MKMRRRSWAMLSVAVLVTLLVSGCWLFGITKVLEYEIESEIVSTDSFLTSVAVDLTEEEDWKDNQDKLDEIYNLLFYGWVQNYESTEASGQLYVYKDGSLTSATEVKNTATLVLDGLAFPADSTVRVPLTEVKLGDIRDLIMEGKFYLYAIATNVPFDIRVFDMSVVVIFAVEAIM